MVSSIPFSTGHSCVESSVTMMVQLEDDKDIPCHGEKQEISEQTVNIECQCDNCSCSDYCGNIVVYNLEIDSRLPTRLFLSSHIIDPLSVRIPAKPPSPLIRPPIFS